MTDPPRPQGFARRLEAGLDAASAAAAWLVLPLALLLFAQWPLRDLVGAWSRDANDAAQWIFALYVAFALRSATRARAHVTAGLAHEGAVTGWRARVARLGEAALVLPWAQFVVVAGAPSIWRSLAGLEAFPDSFNPLYFVVRGAAWLLALLVAIEAMLVLAGRRGPAGGALVVAALLAWPQLVHWADDPLPAAAPAPSEGDIERLLDDAARAGRAGR